jgi:hypothetical protein
VGRLCKGADEKPVHIFWHWHLAAIGYTAAAAAVRMQMTGQMVAAGYEECEKI